MHISHIGDNVKQTILKKEVWCYIVCDECKLLVYLIKRLFHRFIIKVAFGFVMIANSRCSDLSKAHLNIFPKPYKNLQEHEMESPLQGNSPKQCPIAPYLNSLHLHPLIYLLG